MSDPRTYILQPDALPMKPVADPEAFMASTSSSLVDSQPQHYFTQVGVSVKTCTCRQVTSRYITTKADCTECNGSGYVFAVIAKADR